MSNKRSIHPYTLTSQQALEAFESSPLGLSTVQAQERLKHYGLNQLPKSAKVSWVVTFVHQFKSPLIYILLCALVIALLIQEISDAIFIAVVLITNALIGASQESAAERTMQALRKVLPHSVKVYRDEELYQVGVEHLVPGDIVFIEQGDKVPADLRLIESNRLMVDESLLTGESTPVEKNANLVLSPKTSLSDRSNQVFSGTLVQRGHGLGVVTATGSQSIVGQIAKVKKTAEFPLMLRMQRFAQIIALGMAGVVAFMLLMSVAHDTPILAMLYAGIALSVAAIPEGLPVALTVTLAISMKRMAKRNVIVRKLAAVEALGSCTLIATDKTGTLTMNELTVKKISLMSGQTIEITGEGVDPTGQILAQGISDSERDIVTRLAECAVLTNEATMAKTNGEWTVQGDSVDIALLVMARKWGLNAIELKNDFPEKETLPYESEKGFSATLCHDHDRLRLVVKGAPETLLAMASRMAQGSQWHDIDPAWIQQRVNELASQGYRVLALCEKRIPLKDESPYLEQALYDLDFLGLVGIIDPVRKEVPQAIDTCRKAGLKVAMITGDHPLTAFAIGEEIGIIESYQEVVTGQLLQESMEQGPQATDALVAKTTVFARINPEQKMHIVQAMSRLGHFVAVTGDGINDVPAFKSAHVSVSMGKRGTELARETSSLVLTDDRFGSIVAGIEEGRVAYANIRKVIYFTISTGLAEVFLFIMTLLAGLPLPLIPVQLLWLNFVTNGIQDVTLAFEEPEGGELTKKPRNPRERIFDRLMLKRVMLSSLVMALMAYGFFIYIYQWAGSSLEDARNLTLLFMVFFENVQTLNSRSETHSLFKRGLIGNPILLYGVIGTQLIHLGAMMTPGLNEVLQIHVVSPQLWFGLLLGSGFIWVVVELQKRFEKNTNSVRSQLN